MREATRSTRLSVGGDLLKRRVGDVAAGLPIIPKAQQTPVEALLRVLLDYTLNGKRSHADAHAAS